MKRIKEEFLDTLEQYVPLANSMVLEIGSGDDSRSISIAKRCKFLHGIEPYKTKVDLATKRSIPNTSFKVGSGEKLPYKNKFFDVIIFALSFHHIPINEMETAIDESLRVVKDEGFVVFLEPTETGTFFDSEIEFGACDGDERTEKKAAHVVMMNHPQLQLVAEIEDETVFQVNYVGDFVQTLHPKRNIEKINEFLITNKFVLNAKRRINIFQPKKRL